MNIKTEIENIIYEAKYLEVSDIHFHPLENETKIYYRIGGKLIFQKIIYIDKYNKILRYLKFITKLDIAITKKSQDGSFCLEKDKQKIFIRIATIPLIYNESLVIRILQDITNKSLDSLAYEKKDLEEIKEVISKQKGLFIFTGPTGSGKTTTIYSIIDNLVDQEFKKVITIENPVEIINPKFIQVQIDENLGIDYSKSLKSSLRQDPDIIIIGEIRDEETARNAFRAALTGHTVISTMHTKDIYGVIDRFLDFGFLKSEIESVLIGISNQRLILDKRGYIKAIYVYAVGNELEKIIKKQKESDDIDNKIAEVRRKNNEETSNESYEKTNYKKDKKKEKTNNFKKSTNHFKKH